jgi:hypothetical protein
MAEIVIKKKLFESLKLMHREMGSVLMNIESSSRSNGKKGKQSKTGKTGKTDKKGKSGKRVSANPSADEDDDEEEDEDEDEDYNDTKNENRVGSKSAGATSGGRPVKIDKKPIKAGGGKPASVVKGRTETKVTLMKSSGYTKLCSLGARDSPSRH